jgi:hypothetical protein
MRAPLFLAAVAMLMGATAPLPADAACKRMGFLVNDYGKDGPTKDAKSLLDKHVSEWASKAGVKDYSVGPKTVSCELFLNFIVFDEHTCTASATVCWGPDKDKFPKASASAESGAPPTPVRKTAGDAGKKGKVAKTEAAAAPAETEAPSAEAATPEAAPASTGAEAPPQDLGGGLPTPTDTGTSASAQHDVETGTLGAATAPEAPVAPPAAAAPAAAAHKAHKTKASEAASAAAAAAERAAAAAETAANAAKEAAAAAVAASAAGRGSFVPPLGQAANAPKAKSAHRVGDAEQ